MPNVPAIRSDAYQISYLPGSAGAAIVTGFGLLDMGIAVVDDFGHFLAADAKVQALLGRSEQELMELSDLVACVAPELRSMMVATRVGRRGHVPPSAVIHLVLLDKAGERIPADVAIS